MKLENKRDIKNHVDLAPMANQVLDCGDIDNVEVENFKGPVFIHNCLFEYIYRIWLDWNAVDKNTYLSIIQCSLVKNMEIKALLKGVLIGRIDDPVLFMKWINVSYYYECCSEFKIEEL